MMLGYDQPGGFPIHGDLGRVATWTTQTARASWGPR